MFKLCIVAERVTRHWPVPWCVCWVCVYAVQGHCSAGRMGTGGWVGSPSLCPCAEIRDGWCLSSESRWWSCCCCCVPHGGVLFRGCPGVRCVPAVAPEGWSDPSPSLSPAASCAPDRYHGSDRGHGAGGPPSSSCDWMWRWWRIS